MEGRNLLEVVLNTDIAKKFNAVDTAVDGLQKSMERAATSANKFATALSEINKSIEGSNIGNIADNLQKLSSSLNKLENSSGSDNLKRIGGDIQGINTSSQATIDSINNLTNALNKLIELRSASKKEPDNDYYEKAYLQHLKQMRDLELQRFKDRESERQKETENERKELEERKKAWESYFKDLEKREKEKAKLIQLEQESMRRSVSGSLAYSKSTKTNSLEQERKAIKYLIAAREQLSTSDKNYEKILKMLNDEILRHKKNIEKAEGSTRRFREENLKLRNILQQVAGAFGIYIGLQSISNFAKNVAKTTGEFELQHRALQAIIGDMQSANQLWDKTIKLAVRSPYNVKQLVTYTKQLAAYRVESDKLYDTTKMLADISSGLGVDMQRLILAYGQVKAANYLRGQELRQFSEAGINILGELAKYFTELKGQAVSTGQVFEMVSKRMVKFEDVAEVLHRLTEEGGAFYKMQEIQAETLSGIYANLKDRVDLALNSMGQDTRGVLVGLAKAATYLLENWRAFSNMLTSGMIIWGFYKLEVLRAARAKGAFTAATIQATAAEGGFIGMLAKSKLALKAFATSIKTIFTTGLGIAGVVIAAITAIGTALWNHHKRIEESRKKYEELNQVINKNGISGFNKLSDAISENNIKIKENIRLRDEAKESGNKEKEIQLQAEINQLQEKNNKLVDDVKSKYRELSEEIETTADGIVEIGNGAKELAHIQTMTSDITNLFGENAGKKNDITDTTKDLELAFNELDLATSQFNTQFTYWMNNVERELKESTKLSDEFKNSVQGIIDNEALSNLQKYQMIQARVEKSYGGMIKLLGKIDRDYVTSLTSAQSKVNNLTSSISVEIERVSEKLKEMYDIADDKKSAEKASEGFIKNLGFIKGKVSEFLQGMFSEKLDIEVTITPNDEKKELLKWQDKVNEFIQKTVGSKNRETTIPISAEITNADETRDAYRKMVKGLIDDAEEIIRVFEKAKKEGTEQLIYTVDEYNNAVSKLPDLKALYDAVGGEYKKKGANQALELLNKQIDAIKNAASQYKEYKEMYDDVSAFNKTKDAVSDMFKEVGLNKLLGKGFDENVFDEKNIREQMKNWLSAQIAAAGKAGNIAAEKYLRTLQLELDKADYKEMMKTFQKEMGDAFDELDLGRELDKLGIGKDFANILFGIDTRSTDDLRKMVEEWKEGLQAKGMFGTGEEDEYNKQMEKINDIEDKQQKERMKKYINYMQQAMSERVKIETSGMREIMEIEETFDKEIAKAKRDNDMSRANELEGLKQIAIQGSKEETEKSMQKQIWKDFKSSDMYTDLFNDIDTTSTKVIDAVMKKLASLKGSLNQLDPSDLKSIVQEINKLESELIDRNPFQKMMEYYKEVQKMKGAGITEESLSVEYTNKSEEIEQMQQEIDLMQESLYIRQQMTEEQIASEGYTLESFRAENESIRANLNLKKQQVTAKQNEVIGIKQQLQSFKNLRAAAQTYANQWKSMTGSIKSAVESVMDNLDAFGAETNNTTEAWGDLLGSILDIMGVIPLYIAGMTAAGIAVNSAMGIIGLIAEAIQLVITLITALVKVGDAKQQDKIDRIKEKVDKLADAYDRLKEKFDEAWNVDNLRVYRLELQRNLHQRTKYYDEMINAERSKKSPDREQIKEWQDAKQDLQDDYEDVIEDFKKELGGIGESGYKDAAQGFVDAWADAFLETGDGMEGLTEHFNEVLQNLVKKQAMQRIASRYLSGLFTMIDDAIGAEGIVTQEEMNKIKEEFDRIAPLMNEALEAIFGSLGMLGGQNGELDGLQKGIQGVTEDTAEIIAAYLNSIRYYIVDTNTKMGQLLSLLSDTTGIDNPMLNELRNLKLKTEEIRDFLYQRQEIGDNSLRVYVTNP